MGENLLRSWQKKQPVSFYRCRVQAVLNDCFAWLTTEQAMNYGIHGTPVLVFEDRAGEMVPFQAAIELVEPIEEC